MELSDLDFSKTYSYADYLQWTFEDRVELIRGKIFKITFPNTNHQRSSMVISCELYNYLKGKVGKVFSAPFDVRLPRRSEEKEDKKIFTVVQPDVCVICDLTKLDFRGCTGAPDIVAEILSPGNNEKELRNKYEAYEEAAVKEYWIISPQDKTFLKYTLTLNGKYEPSKLMTMGDIITTPILPGFALDLETVFADIP
jgi:Uma2 family endonuclease